MGDWFVILLRDHSRRNQDLRAFIAENRRKHRAKQGDCIGDDVSVWAVAGAGGLDESPDGVQPVADPAAPSLMRIHDDGSVVGAQRNIGLDFDQEKVCAGEGRAEGGTLEAKDDASNEETGRERSSNCGGGRGVGDSSTSLPPAIAASLSLRTSNAERKLAGLSMLEAPVVAEIHEVRSTAWSFRPLTNQGNCL